eukprot:scaffold103677_cov51-Prasinocladus_malaysianus.AAC.1
MSFPIEKAEAMNEAVMCPVITRAAILGRVGRLVYQDEELPSVLFFEAYLTGLCPERPRLTPEPEDLSAADAAWVSAGLRGIVRNVVPVALRKRDSELVCWVLRFLGGVPEQRDPRVHRVVPGLLPPASPRRRRAGPGRPEGGRREERGIART